MGLHCHIPYYVMCKLMYVYIHQITSYAYMVDKICLNVFGPFVPSASVDETKVKSPLVGENCMIDSDQSSDFNQNHTHHRRSDTFTPLPRLAIPPDLFSFRTAGSKQSWGRKQEVQKKTDDTSNPGAEGKGQARAPPSAWNRQYAFSSIIFVHCFIF